jgi:hypothetical protein
MTKEYIGGKRELLRFVDKCKTYAVEQFTARPVTNISLAEVRSNRGSEEVQKWIEKNGIHPQIEGEIETHMKEFGTKLLELAHGATVYDLCGQNVSINTCLTRSVNPDDMRQLIFFPDGHLRYDWVKQGAIIF